MLIPVQSPPSDTDDHEDDVSLNTEVSTQVSRSSSGSGREVDNIGTTRDRIGSHLGELIS
jgi:hypothetical protein